MRGPFPDFEALYRDEPTRALACHAARVEAEGYGRWTRVREVVELAHRMGYRRIGVAHCPEMEREARLAGYYLQDRGLEVVLPVGVTVCEPRKQADLLADRDTSFNVIAGMYVGHDSATMGRLGIPAICVVAKDRVAAHNTVAALYALEDGLGGRGSGLP
jgi:uncharacterized metal-binding protein